MTKAKLTILGCGNSTGVPAAGNHWGACDPLEPKNRRTRSSIAVQTDTTTIIVDTGPDFRDHMNKADIKHIHAVFYTHAHADHMNGMDDVRGYVFRQKQKMPTYASAETFADLEGYFPYMFQGGRIALYPPLLDKNIVTDQPFSVGNIPVTPLVMDHESCTATGYRFGNTAYCVDFVRLDDKAVEALKGIDTWIVDSAGYNQNDIKVHANLQTIFDLNARIGAKRVILTSLSLAMDYQTLIGELPQGYEPGYDGMVLDVNL
ncbi:MAG TPA: MBL fold metallo-hydrolase [Alphaproteobacteria bacterium]|nr:MBL fold metallo-hydrolase [Alphaproteobacteria bacterium]